MNNPFLISKNVYLRPLEKEDADTFVSWIEDWELVKNIPQRFRFPFNTAKEKEHINNLYKSSDNIVLAIIYKSEEKFIGTTGFGDINPVNRTAVFGLVIGDKNYRNKGLGTEILNLMLKYGFNILNFNRIYLEVNADNIPAIKLYEKAGFKIEGCLRQDYYFDGEYKDKLIMGILKGEFRNSE